MVVVDLAVGADREEVRGEGRDGLHDRLVVAVRLRSVENIGMTMDRPVKHLQGRAGTVDYERQQGCGYPQPAPAR